MKRYAIRKEAALELAEAAAWYEHEAAEGLGAALLAEFEARLETALKLPGAGTIVATTTAGTPVRRYRLQRFKRYAILMAEIRGMPTVLAFACSSRRPGYWHERLG
ncbi:MAG: type II toxin-antitoxin system RelE/ParE family toxin [Myxococcota bacterium]